jgi:hypothetical protein
MTELLSLSPILLHGSLQIEYALTPALQSAGWTTIKGAFAMALMVQGFSRGLIKFALISGTKAA